MVNHRPIGLGRLDIHHEVFEVVRHLVRVGRFVVGRFPPRLERHLVESGRLALPLLAGFELFNDGVVDRPEDLVAAQLPQLLHELEVDEDGRKDVDVIYTLLPEGVNAGRLEALVECVELALQHLCVVVEHLRREQQRTRVEMRHWRV